MHPHIEDYALIGDHQTAALVSNLGSIDWLCLPRFDSAACFAALLGDEENGHWRIAPRRADACTRRAYRHDTLVLDTEWETDEGRVRVTDLMPQRDRSPDVVRLVEGLDGRVTVRSTLRLRYGWSTTWGCSRRSTTPSRADSSGTSRRRSVTSVSSVPPSPCSTGTRQDRGHGS